MHRHHAPASSSHRLVILPLALSLLSPALATTAAVAAPPQWGVAAAFPDKAGRASEGMAARLDVRASSRRTLSLLPSASLKLWPRGGVALMAGADLVWRLPATVQRPLPLLVSAGMDLLGGGCVPGRICYLGAGGANLELALVVWQPPERSAWALTLGLDHDVRFGPRHDTRFVVGARMLPGELFSKDN